MIRLIFVLLLLFSWVETSFAQPEDKSVGGAQIGDENEDKNHANQEGTCPRIDSSVLMGARERALTVFKKSPHKPIKNLKRTFCYPYRAFETCLAGGGIALGGGEITSFCSLLWTEGLLGLGLNMEQHGHLTWAEISGDVNQELLAHMKAIAALKKFEIKAERDLGLVNGHRFPSTSSAQGSKAGGAVAYHKSHLPRSAFDAQKGNAYGAAVTAIDLMQDHLKRRESCVRISSSGSLASEISALTRATGKLKTASNNCRGARLALNTAKIALQVAQRLEQNKQ